LAGFTGISNGYVRVLRWPRSAKDGKTAFEKPRIFRSIADPWHRIRSKEMMREDRE
jgi:hypothetical protein